MFFFLFSLETHLFYTENTLLLEVDLGESHTYFEYGSDFLGKPIFLFENHSFEQLPFFEPQILKEDEYFLGYKKYFRIAFKKIKDIKEDILKINFVYCENKLCKYENKKINFNIDKLPSFSKDILEKIPKNIDEKIVINVNKYLPYDKEIYPYENFTMSKEGFLVEKNEFKALTKKGIVHVQLRKIESLWYIYLLAFLGGIILNFMPCVLPVIGFKLSVRQKKSVYLNYTLGIFFTFVLFAFLAIIFKSSFQWGFQFQSPVFLYFFSLLILLLLIDIYAEKNFFNQLSLLAPYVDKIGRLKDFFDGFISTLLSTPCTGPFLTTALGASLILEPYQILLLFSLMALGFSFPVLSYMMIPSLKVLPDSGPWLESFKEFLNSSLIFLFAWIIYLSIFNFNTYLYLASLSCFFIFFILKNSFFKKVFLIVGLIFSFFLFQPKKDIFVSQLNPFLIEEKSFVSFTAKWCLTCQFNKKLLLEKSYFKNFLKKNHLKAVEISLDKYNEEANNYLKDLGVRGIPAYFFKEKEKSFYLGGFFTEEELQEAYNNF